MCCSRMAAAPRSSTPPARVPCSASPAHCPAVIHSSSPALPYMGTLSFLAFPALGGPMPKSVFSYALTPVFSPGPCQEQVTDPTCLLVLPTQQLLGVPLSHAIPFHLSHHRCHPHPQAHVPSSCSNPCSFLCPQMMPHMQQVGQAMHPC